MTSSSPHPGSPYRGRFAPSPTGPLHQGSLLAAVASYLEADKHQGEWLVRMEDVDELRNVKGAADNILRSLEAYGFEWQGEVLYQTQRKDAYTEALQQLISQDLCYPCQCSRRKLRADADAGKINTGPFGIIYPGYCTQKTFAEMKSPTDYSIRVKVSDDTIQFTDQCLGKVSQNLARDLGDFIIRRRDGLFAYQLAVVVDDAYQNISHIVRGADLLDSTPRQIYLQACLGVPQPDYLHLPLILHPNGDKLSKQTGAQCIGHKANIALLVECLELLGQQPPEQLKQASLNDFWDWAKSHWKTENIPSENRIK